MPPASLPYFRRDKGFSLVELMIAVTIGLFILAGMSGIFVASSRSHNELEKASRQVESGRYAIELLREEIELAGFYGDYQPISATVWTTPDPCATAVADLLFTAAAAATPNVPTGIFGYDSTGALSSSCAAVLANKRSGTDALVIRRVRTESVAASSTLLAGEYYLQVSNCSATPAEASFVLATAPGSFTLHTVKPASTTTNCLTGDVSPLRKYVVGIYYIADCSDCSGAGDGIPTLKLAELAAGGTFTLRAMAEGIENMQLEYGTDNAGNDGIPDTYVAAGSVTNWSDIVSVKAFILARNTEATIGYTNTKTYVLNSSGDNSTGISVNDNYRRHVYSVAARANNISGRRQQ